MFEAIKHGLGNLLNFNGRDARQAFWFYVLFVYLISIVVSMVVAVPMMFHGVMDGIRVGTAAGQSSDPAAVQAATEAAITGSMMDAMASMMWVGLVTNLLMMLVLAASFVRQLHDSDLAGWWALIPGAMQIANMILAPALMQRMFERMHQMQAAGDPMDGMRGMQSSMSTASVLGWGAILFVIAIGIRQSTPGPNRYGEAPFVA
jgi:uncharacterized membrane protein YhaH (DUF805 family)